MLVDAVRNTSLPAGQPLGHEHERLLAPQGLGELLDHGFADDVDRVNRVALVVTIHGGEIVDGLPLRCGDDRIAHAAMPLEQRRQEVTVDQPSVAVR